MYYYKLIFFQHAQPVDLSSATHKLANEISEIYSSLSIEDQTITVPFNQPGYKALQAHLTEKYRQPILCYNIQTTVLEQLTRQNIPLEAYLQYTIQAQRQTLDPVSDLSYQKYSIAIYSTVSSLAYHKGKVFNIAERLQLALKQLPPYIQVKQSSQTLSATQPQALEYLESVIRILTHLKLRPSALKLLKTKPKGYIEIPTSYIEGKVPHEVLVSQWLSMIIEIPATMPLEYFQDQTQEKITSKVKSILTIEPIYTERKSPKALSKIESTERLWFLLNAFYLMSQNFNIEVKRGLYSAPLSFKKIIHKFNKLSKFSIDHFKAYLAKEIGKAICQPGIKYQAIITPKISTQDDPVRFLPGLGKSQVPT